MNSVRNLFVAVVAISIAVAPAYASAQDRDDARGLEEMLARVNEMRAAAGLAPLMRDERLDRAARLHSEDMADHDMVAHVSPRSGDPAARVAAQGVAVVAMSENISVNADVVAAHDAFVASETHRANLLNPTFNRIGLGVARATRGVYVTQVFANVNDGTSGANLPAPSSSTTTVLATPPVPAAVQSAQPTQVRVPASGGRNVTGYWVQSGGRWWYYPLPPNAQPGQVLTPATVQPSVAQPAVSVQPAPYSYVAQPAPYVYSAPRYYYPAQTYVPPVTPVVVQPIQPIQVVAPPAFGWSPRRHYSRWYWR